MTKEEIFLSISNHLSGNPFSHVLVLLLVFIIFLFFTLIYVVIIKAKREKTDGEIIKFLKIRHRLKDYELKILLEIGQIKDCYPEYLLIIDQNIFKENRVLVRKKLLQLFKIEKQTDNEMDALYNKLFK